MPTYDDLRNYFEQSGQLQEAVRATVEIPIVSGFTLKVDPLWCLLYDIENDLIGWHSVLGRWPRDIHHLVDDLMHFPPERWRVRLFDALTDLMTNRFQGYRRRDLYRPVKLWDELASSWGVRQRSPVNLTVVHRPLRSPTKEIPGTSDQEQLQRLVQAIAQSQTSVRIEERPPARLALAPGDAIQVGNNSSGTLGGVLDDLANGKSYGMTCAHVAATGNTVSDGAGTIIGTCTADTVRVTLRVATVCDPINLAVPNPSPGNGPDINMLDCALIELTSTVTRPKLGGIATTLTPGQNVTLQGASTGKSHHKLGSLCLSYSFNQSGQDFCFRDTIELLPQPWGPFGGALGQMMTKIPSQGDSGAWVLTADHPPDWAGIFFGEDGQRGFLIRSSWAHEWSENAVGSSLTL